LNPYKPNVLDIEKAVMTRIKCGYLLKEPSGFWESGFQNKWFELTVDHLMYFDNPRVVNI